MFQALGNALTIKDAVEFIWESVKKLQDSNAQSELNNIDISILDEIRSIGDSVTQDALDRYITESFSVYKPDKTYSGDLFSGDFREAFANKFIAANPDTKLYEDKVKRVIDISLSRLETTLSRILSYDSFQNLRLLLDNNYQLQILQGMLREFEQTVRPARDDIQEMRDNIQKIEAGVNRLISRTNAQNRDIAQTNNHPPIPLGATEEYAAEYESPLFKHPGNCDICLRNLYIPPDFNIHNIQPQNNENFCTGVSKVVLNGLLHDLIQTHLICNDSDDDDLEEEKEKPEETRFIFFEGKSGCGKSSLAAYMSYYYLQDREQFMGGLFKTRHFIVVRMRELNTSLHEQASLHSAILNYLGVKKIGRNTILFLDGYEEFQSISEYQGDALQSLEGLGWRIIVTSRPGLIKIEDFFLSPCCTILDLNIEKKTYWLDCYERFCGPLNNGLKDSVKEESSQSGPVGRITNIPLGLYMMATASFETVDLENQWRIYNQVFSSADVQGNSLCQELAYIRFQNHRKEDTSTSCDERRRSLCEQSTLDSSILREKRKGRFFTGKIQGKSFALCGCWNASIERGYIDFYSERIRDYFLCERILNGLNRCYSEKNDEVQKIRSLEEFLCETLRHDRLSDRVMMFIRCHLNANASKSPDSCLLAEMNPTHSYLPQFLENLLTNDIPFSTANGKNPISVASIIFYNIFSLYKVLYDIIYNVVDNQHKCIKWWNRVGIINESGAFRMLSKEILPDVHSNSSEGRYSGNISDFGDVDLNHANLSNKNLAGANLSYADLSHADLSGADLREANLESANLLYADFMGAKLDGCNLRSALNVEYAQNISPQYLE